MKWLINLYNSMQAIPVNQLTGKDRFIYSAWIQAGGSGRQFLDIDKLKKPLETEVK